MALKQELDTLLNTEMDRKTFIKHIAFAAAMVTGVSVFAKMIGSMNRGQMNIAQISGASEPRRTGYGRVGYGTKLERDS